MGVRAWTVHRICEVNQRLMALGRYLLHCCGSRRAPGTFWRHRRATNPAIRDLAELDLSKLHFRFQLPAGRHAAKLMDVFALPPLAKMLKTYSISDAHDNHGQDSSAIAE
jgi:hypothetical protein